jgi:hypothetical protein
MAALQAAHKSGGWVLLQNIHLTIDWTTGPLQRAVDKLGEGAHPDFRWGCVSSFVVRSFFFLLPSYCLGGQAVGEVPRD